MKENRKEILELLQQQGCLEVSENMGADIIKHESNDVFDKMNTATQISIYERNSALAENALEILQQYCPEKTSVFSSLEGERIISKAEYLQTVENQQEIVSVINEIIQYKKQIIDYEAKIARFRDEIKALEPWENLDVPMNYDGTKYTGFMIGTIPGTYDQEKILQKIDNLNSQDEQSNNQKSNSQDEQSINKKLNSQDGQLNNQDYMAEDKQLKSQDFMYIQVIRADKFQTYVAVTYVRDARTQTEKILRKLGFSKPVVTTHHIPTESIAKRNNWMKELELDIENLKAIISEKAKRRQEIKNVADYYRIRAQKYKVLGQLAQTKHTFFVGGYIAEEDLTRLKDTLENKYGAVIDVEYPMVENNQLTKDIPMKNNSEEIPVKLTNNKFSGAVEGVVTAFGYPNKKEIDPTSITAIFYYFLFGIMFSDAAYGFIMALACFVLLKKYPNMKDTMANTFRMFMYCGISTMIWGILFGGYFGNAIPVISETFFGKKMNIPPLWFEPLNEPMKMLIYCLGFGIIHLFTGLALKGYLALKEKDYETFIYDVILWYVFLIGLLMLLIPSSIFASLAGTQITFPTWLTALSKIMALGGMIGILLMGGRRSKNPFKRLLLGAYSLYDTTSWLSDLLSYSRLLALGLATGVIAQVINTMAAMGGKSVAGVILFIVVFVGGHTFNMAINVLGAYVHTNRLAFVEFFGKFYEGGGREFKPFKTDTKYVKVKEN